MDIDKVIRRGKTLTEWKEYSEKDDIPIRASKYIIVLEETIEQIKEDKELTYKKHRGFVSDLVREITSDRPKSDLINLIKAYMPSVVEKHKKWVDKI